LKNEKLLNLEGHELRYGWHGYLWYDKVKVNVDFKNHYIRRSLLRIWNKYKLELCHRRPLWISTQEAFYRTETRSKEKWLTYKDFLKKEQGQYCLN